MAFYIESVLRREQLRDRVAMDKDHPSGNELF